MTLRGFYIPLRLIAFRALAVGVVVLLFAAVWGVLYRIEVPPTLRAPISTVSVEEEYYYYQTPALQKKVALTFDDGPFETDTLAVADILQKYHVPATFFFIGSHVLQYPGIAKEIHDRGFLIGNHSYSHQMTVHESYQRLEKELNSTSYLLYTITGEVPFYYRPPYLLGIGTDATVNPELPIPKDVSWTLQAGYVPVGIDIDTYDWALADSNGVLSALKAAYSGGHMVLMHDDKIAPETLVSLIKILRDKGYTFVTVDDLLTPPKEIALTGTFGLGATDNTTNGEVSKLQWFLYTARYLTPYDVTGVFTEDTKDALIHYQLATGIISSSAPNPIDEGRTSDATRARVWKDSILLAPSIDKGTPPPETWSTVWARAVIYSIGGATSLLKFLVMVSIVVIGLRLLALVPLALTALVREHKTSKESSSRYFVSILIPAWNEEENIEGTLKSVITTEYPRYEVIVINDGSLDRTAGIAERFMLEHPGKEIRVLSQENAGKAAALNRGTVEAKGEVLIIMDGDATFTPQTVGELVKHFDNERVGAVSGKVYPVGPASPLMYMQTLEYMIGQNIDKRGLGVLNALPVVPGPVGAWRKSDVVKVGGFTSETLVEDQDMTLAMLAMGKRVVYEPRAIAYTEAPTKVSQFLKQRYRWIFGSYRCFGKYLDVLIGYHTIDGKRVPPRLNSALALINIFVFGIVLPLIYPLIDLILLYALFTGGWEQVVLPVALFTIVDTVYATIALWNEKGALGPVAIIPLVRVFYRQLLLYVVVKSLVTWLEGTTLGWMKLKKSGEAQRHFAAISN